MAEYIEREPLHNKTYEITTATGTKRVVMYDDVVLAPAADVAPVVHGHWVYGEFDIPNCSECGEEVKPDTISPFCPNCGAKMDEEV